MPDWIKHKIKWKTPIDVNALIAYLGELDISGIEELNDQIIVHYRINETSKAIFDLCLRLDMDVQHELAQLKDENWNAIWESSYEPVIIDDFCVIQSDFHQIDPKDFKHSIVINPQMSFGTGHHATTQLMIKSMNDYSFEGKTVLDFGTGTGVLAIFSKYLGASRVVGIDNSHIAVENAIENAMANQTKDIIFIHDDKPITSFDGFDIVLVNIIRSVIMKCLDQLSKLVNPNGLLILSGFLKPDAKKILFAVLNKGFELKQERTLDEWVCQVYQKSSSN